MQPRAAASSSPLPSPLPPTAASPSALNLRTVTTEIHALLADVEETARRVAAQIDNRRSRLEQLLAEADEKIKRLESLTAATPAAVVATPVQRDASQTLSRLRQERGAPPVNEDPAYRPVYQLADEGKSSREIGQALNRQPGEIELILALAESPKRLKVRAPVITSFTLTKCDRFAPRFFRGRAIPWFRATAV